MKKTDKEKQMEQMEKATDPKKPLTHHLAKLSEEYIRDVFGDDAWESASANSLKDHEQLIDVKTIDIHTMTEVTNTDRYKRSIDNISVKQHVFQNIDFPLNDTYWNLIDSTFSDIWNNKLGIGAEFYWDDISKWIFAEFQNRKILIEYGRIDIIANLILTYIKNTGGFLE